MCGNVRSSRRTMENIMRKPEHCKSIKKEPLGSSRGEWIELSKVYYTNTQGEIKDYEVVSRTTRKAGVDGISLIPIAYGGRFDELQVVLVRQFRAAVGRPVIEFPGGVLDEGETPEQCALRELKEETGYSGEIRHSGGEHFANPSLSDENAMFIVVEVNLNLPCNQNPIQELDGQEDCIEVIMVPLGSLLKYVTQTTDAVEGILKAFALSQSLTKILS